MVCKRIPDVVVFDLGKVLVDFDYIIAAQKIAARASLPASEIKSLIDQSSLLLRYECGGMTNDEFFSEICRITGFTGSLPEFADLFGDIFSPIDSMIQLHQALHARRVPTYVFSNTNGMAVAHIRKAFPFFRNFDGYVFSFEHGAMKPDAKLYEVLERISGRSGEQVLYLDDRVENVAAGQARGWQVLHHESPSKTAAAFRELGLLE